MFKNEYIVSKNFVTIILKSKKGEREECYVDHYGFSKLLNLGLSWHLLWSNTTQSYYAKATKYEGLHNGKPKYRTILMHRILMDCTEDMTVDHLNYNTLDNRYGNLRMVNLFENNQNKENRPNRNSKTGVRNVCYSNAENKYIVQFQIDGRNTQMAKFDNLESAKDYADKYRPLYYKNA